MNRKILILLLILTNLLFCLGAIHPADSILFEKICIHPDGTISPSDVPITRVGDTFIVTSDISDQIVVECNNALIDGGEHILHGDGGGVALNLTCSNVTVLNLQISNWDAGILGVFNNNTIQQCHITKCDSALKLYAQYYVIIQNDLENNDEAIRVGDIGSHFIAGNNIDNNKVGFTLYYSGNVIVQNNIAHCSQYAMLLDNTGWTQTVYNNNFVDNAKDLIDYTYSNSLNRPVQSVIPPWDNSVSGNYWSNYTGVDQNSDGIGDTAEQIPTYHRENTLAFYTFVDRYPLMVPQNIDTSLPPIPDSTISPVYPKTFPENQPKALSFLKDVFQVNLNSYDTKLTYSQIKIDGSTVTQNFAYLLTKDSNFASATFCFSNTTLISCDFYTGLSTPLLDKQTTDYYETAKNIIQNYKTWTGDDDVSRMVDAITVLGSSKNGTTISGNILLSAQTYNFHSTYEWSYIFNGVDYNNVILDIGSYNQNPHNIRFSDDRFLNSIGDTSVVVTKEQAIAIAEDYVKNNFTYLSGVSSLNDSAIYVSGLGVIDENTTAGLATTNRNSSMLYPYWEIHVALDDIYPGRVAAVNVRVWADSGTVFWARTEADGSGLLPSLFTFPVLAPLMFLLAGGVTFAVAILVVLMVFLKRMDKQQPTNH